MKKYLVVCVLSLIASPVFASDFSLSGSLVNCTNSTGPGDDTMYVFSAVNVGSEGSAILYPESVCPGTIGLSGTPLPGQVITYMSGALFDNLGVTAGMTLDDVLLATGGYSAFYQNGQLVAPQYGSFSASSAALLIGSSVSSFGLSVLEILTGLLALMAGYLVFRIGWQKLHVIFDEKGNIISGTPYHRKFTGRNADGKWVIGQKIPF